VSDHRLTDLITALEARVEAADPRVRTRKEWKAADSWVRAVEPDAVDGTDREDTVREGEALRDLLDLASSEVKARVDAEDATKRARLSEDEELLGMLSGELKIYGGLIFAAFLIPPATLTMLGAFCGFGVLPAVFGFARMFSATAKVDGRAWLILQDRVDQLLQRIKMAHGGAAGAVLLTILWVVIALLADEVAV